MPPEIPIEAPLVVNRNSIADRDRLYAEAIAAHGQTLSRLVSGYEANADQRRDLLQEIHVALWTSFASFSGDCTLKTWVYRIGHNVAINHATRDKRRHDHVQFGLDELDSPAHASDLMENIDASNTLERLRAMIQKLKTPDRQIILLYLDDVDAATIAQVTGMSASNVATKIHRIKQILARNFHSRRANHE